MAAPPLALADTNGTIAPGAPDAPEPALSMRGVGFRYPATGFALVVEAFSLPAGGRVFLRGPSGSGKTTFLSLATGLLAADGGAIHVAGQAMPRGGAGRDRLRAGAIGVIHQQFNLLPYLDVVANVTLPLAFSPERRARAGDADAGARALLSRLGVPAELHRTRASRLSVGQQQRVAIARALLGAPPLVVADEPTSALDVDARDAFLDLLFESVERSGAALLMVSHDPAIGRRFPARHDLREIATVVQAEAA